MKRLEPGKTEVERLRCDLQRIEMKAKTLRDLIKASPDDPRVELWEGRIAEIERPAAGLRAQLKALTA